jgi:hypothetical protein
VAIPSERSLKYSTGCYLIYEYASLVEGGCKEGLQTCSMDESCQPGSLHDIAIWRVPGEGATTAESSQNSTVASRFPSLGVRLMIWASRGVSKSISSKKVIRMSSSQRVSIRVTRSSKYSITPLKRRDIDIRAGMTNRFYGGGGRVSRSGRD